MFLEYIITAGSFKILKQFYSFALILLVLRYTNIKSFREIIPNKLKNNICFSLTFHPSLEIRTKTNPEKCLKDDFYLNIE